MLGRLLLALLIISVLSSCAYQRALNEEKEAAKNPKATANTRSTTFEAPQQGSSVSNMNAPQSGAASASKMISPLTSY